MHADCPFTKDGLRNGARFNSGYDDGIHICKKVREKEMCTAELVVAQRGQTRPTETIPGKNKARAAKRQASVQRGIQSPVKAVLRKTGGQGGQREIN